MASPFIWTSLGAKALTTNAYNKDGTRFALISDVTAGAAMTPDSKSANFTAAAAKMYLCDTSASAFTATLPSGAANAQIRFIDSEQTWATYNLTITPASGQKIMGLSTNESLICDVSGSWCELVWDATNSWWTIASNGAVNAANVEYYAYTTGATSFTIATTNNTAGNVVAGSSGQLIPNVASGDTTAGSTDFLVGYSSAASTDDLLLEIQQAGTGPWFPAEYRYPYQRIGAACYGMQIFSSSGNIYVGFGRAGASNDVTSGSTGTSWSSINGTGAKWRVRKTSGRSVSYPEVVPGVTSGLVAAQGLKGNPGTAAPAGYLGEIMSSTSSSQAVVAGTGSFQNLGASVTLTAGIWLITGTVMFTTGTMTGKGNIDATINTTNTNNDALYRDLVYSDDDWSNIGCWPVVVPSSTTYTMYGRVSFTTAGNATWAAKIYAVRIA